MPQPRSSGSPRISIPFARSSSLVCAMSSHRKRSSCVVEPSDGWAASSAGGRAKINQASPASTCSQPSASRNTPRSASASGVKRITCAPVIKRPILCRVRWPRKNDPGSIRARQEALGLDGLVTSIDLEQFTGAAETVTGVAVIPVSVVPLDVELGTYELDDAGAVRETGRSTETVHVPLAHTEGGLTVSMTRGATAAGSIRTYVLHDRITRASCFICKNVEQAVQLARWLEGELEALRAWLAESGDSS